MSLWYPKLYTTKRTPHLTSSRLFSIQVRISWRLSLKMKYLFLACVNLHFSVAFCTFLSGDHNQCFPDRMSLERQIAPIANHFTHNTLNARCGTFRSERVMIMLNKDATHCSEIHAKSKTNGISFPPITSLTPRKSSLTLLGHKGCVRAPVVVIAA